MSSSVPDSRRKIGPYLGYVALMGDGKRAVARPRDDSQSFRSDVVASVCFAHSPFVKASHIAELHIGGKRSVLRPVNQSHDNGRD